MSYYTEEDNIQNYWELRHKEWMENPNWGNYPFKQAWFDERFAHLLPPKSEEVVGGRWPIGKVLDYGCGCGLYAKNLVERFQSYRGFDTSESAIEAAHTYYKQFPELSRRMFISLYTGKPGNFEPNVKDEYDLIISITVLQHQPLTYRLAMIENIKRLLKPSGLYIGLEWNGLETSAYDMPPVAREDWIKAWEPMRIVQDIPSEHPEWQADNVWVARK